MIHYTVNLLKKIQSEIKIISLEENDLLNVSMKLIPILKNYCNELRAQISEYSFENEKEEILFFKEIKPKLFSELLYYCGIYKFETSKPTGSAADQRAFIVKQLDRLKDFFDNNIDFYRYYRARKTDLDESLFLRGKPEIELSIDGIYIERDLKFSTGFDIKVAIILSNDMLSTYLNAELTKLDRPVSDQLEKTNFPKTIETWTGSKVALIELIYALHASGSINNGKTDIKRLTLYMEKIFNIDLGDVYRTFLEIRGRKGNRVQYMDELRKKLLARMDEVDNT